MYYVFLVTILLSVIRVVMLERSRKRKKCKAGNVSLRNNIVELSRKGKK